MLVLPAGLEPATYALGSRRSIQSELREQFDYFNFIEHDARDNLNHCRGFRVSYALPQLL